MHWRKIMQRALVLAFAAALATGLHADAGGEEYAPTDPGLQ